MSDEKESKEPQQTIEPISGYVIGRDAENKIIFEIFQAPGENGSVAELLGFHQIASLRLQTILESSHSAGWPLVAGNLAEVEQQLTQVVVLLRTLLAQQTQEAPSQEDIPPSDA
jgi:hypothetical protein